MADPIGVYVTSPPGKKSSDWQKINGYVRYIIVGLMIFGGLRLIAWLQWLFQ